MLKKENFVKKIKKRSPTYWRKKCVTWAKNKAKELVGYKCEHCGRKRSDGWQIHGSHIYPEGTYIAMSCDPDNILALCARCHTGGMWKNSKYPAWHTDPVYFGEWFNKKYPERALRLKLKSREIKAINWELKWNELKNT